MSGEIVARNQGEHDDDADCSCERYEPDQAAHLPQVHEEPEDQSRLGKSDTDIYDRLERTQRQKACAERQSQKRHERNPDEDEGTNMGGHRSHRAR